MTTDPRGALFRYHVLVDWLESVGFSEKDITKLIASGVIKQIFIREGGRPGKNVAGNKGLKAFYSRDQVKAVLEAILKG